MNTDLNLQKLLDALGSKWPELVSQYRIAGAIEILGLLVLLAFLTVGSKWAWRESEKAKDPSDKGFLRVFLAFFVAVFAMAGLAGLVEAVQQVIVPEAALIKQLIGK